MLSNYSLVSIIVSTIVLIIGVIVCYAEIVAIKNDTHPLLVIMSHGAYRLQRKRRLARFTPEKTPVPVPEPPLEPRPEPRPEPPLSFDIMTDNENGAYQPLDDKQRADVLTDMLITNKSNNTLYTYYRGNRKKRMAELAELRALAHEMLDDRLSEDDYIQFDAARNLALSTSTRLLQSKGI